LPLSTPPTPIPGPTFMGFGLPPTRTAALTIGAAAIDDVAGWLLLGVISLIVANRFSALWLVQRIGWLALYLILMFALVRPVLRRFIARDIRQHGHLSHS